MWEWLIALLIDLLVKFLVELFKADVPISVSSLKGRKDDFLDRVQVRFWFGFRRIELASKAYKLMLENLENAPIMDAVHTSRGDHAKMADLLVSGVKAKLISTP